MSMTHQLNPPDYQGIPVPDRQALLEGMAPFQASMIGRSLWQVGSTLVGLIILEALMYKCLLISRVLTLSLALPATGLLLRIFVIQHDCGHGSFFHVRWANDMLGRFCSLFTFTPYAFWRRQHANHHASFNNLDRRDTGIDIYSTCTTLAEFRALSPWGQITFRITHHPILTQLVFPPLVFLLLYRVPFDAPAHWLRERRSVWITDLMVVCVVLALVSLNGVWAVVMVQLPILVFASIIGMWLFSVQHRFEEAQWARQPGWNLIHAALRGSSYLKLPTVLQWFTGNIGFHHIHHLSARIPNYRLQECHESRPDLKSVTTLTLRQALLAPSFTLWDEAQGCMVRCP
ncbi:fatty acid desaturase family protein [Lichenicoccus roseus]|uniref:Fatty acid desaturase n=1 Tax=Lichenicoccus roseus TaxID=2683649 RepID=A0A5R9J1C6_9PROT|nr:fatty acid desaturase [Lichenicoccus roseus]TLU70759.1 fatty acid desaturase [Lichenicoccus roseus]